MNTKVSAFNSNIHMLVHIFLSSEYFESELNIIYNIAIYNGNNKKSSANYTPKLAIKTPFRH